MQGHADGGPEMTLHHIQQRACVYYAWDCYCHGMP